MTLVDDLLKYLKLLGNLKQYFGSLMNIWNSYYPGFIISEARYCVYGTPVTCILLVTYVGKIQAGDNLACIKIELELSRLLSVYYKNGVKIFAS